MEALGPFRLVERRLGVGADDLILGFKYLKECQVEQKSSFCIILVDRVRPKVQNIGQQELSKQ